MYAKRKKYTKAQVASYYAGLRAGKRSSGRSRSRSRKSRSYRRY